MRSPLSLFSSPARGIAGRLAGLGAAGFAAVLVIVPMAHAETPAAPSTDTGTPPPTGPATPSDSPTTGTGTSTGTAATSEPAAVPTDASSDPAPSPTGPGAPTKAATAKTGAKIKPAVVTPDVAVGPNYGAQKVFIGVQTKSGGYYPPGVSTAGSVIELLDETVPGVVPASSGTTTCTTVAQGTGPGSSCFPGFFGGYTLAPGHRLTLRQIAPPQPGMLIDPAPQAVEPCVFPVPALNIAKPQIAPAAVPTCSGSPNFVSVNFIDPGLPPVAVNDASAVQTGSSVNIPVLSNDQTSGAPTTISAVSTPAHGHAVIIGGHIHYTSNLGFFGADVFTYTITTPNGSATATVSLTVTAPPIAVDDSASTVGGTDTAGNPVTVHVLANDKAQGGTLALRAAGAAAHGSVAISGAAIIYTPAAGFAGADRFTYTITNGHGTSTATVTVTVTAPLVVATAGSSLANTGTPSEQLLSTGSILLITGAGLLLVGRRRRGIA
jgi:hypothetical protein